MTHHIVTQAPSVAPQNDFDGSVGTQDTIPAVIVGVASSVIICAVLLFVTDLRDRCKHQRLLDEREERRRARAEVASSKQVEGAESSEIISTHTSVSATEKYQPQFVEKASESSVSTMTSLGCLRAAESEDLEHSLEVTELREAHRVSQGTDLAYVLELKVPQGTGLAYLVELKRLMRFRECRDIVEEGMDSQNFRVIEGDCSGSQIGSVMDDDDVYLDDDVGSVSASRRSYVSRSSASSTSHRTPQPQKFGNLSSRSEPRLGISPCASPQGSQHSAMDNMSMASSIRSVETAPGKLTRGTHDDAFSPSHCKSLSKSMTSPTASLGSPSVYAMSEQPTSPLQRNTKYPDSIYRTPIEPFMSARPEDDDSIARCGSMDRTASDRLPSPTLLQRTTETLAHDESPKSDLAQLEQLYSKELLPLEEYSASMHRTMLEKIEEVVGMQAYIRHVDYAPGNNNSLTLGIALMDARSNDTFPMVEAIKETSPLLDQVFVGDYIIAVNDVETRGLGASEVAKLLVTDEQRDDDEEEESDTMPIVRLTIQSSLHDCSESDSYGDDEFSDESKPSETKSEV